MTTSTFTAATSVDAFLDSITSGRGIPPDVYAAGATLDATVPGWRFQVAGAGAICAEYAKWFAHPALLEELERRATRDGEVVTYLITWEEHGVPHAGRHCHVLTVDTDGRIVHDSVWCGGRWDAQLLAEMGATVP